MKNHHHNSPIRTPSVVAVSAPLHEAIAARAYELWGAQGHPENCDKAIWLEAEGQLAAVQHVPLGNRALSTDS
jgi:hypothetical protein